MPVTTQVVKLGIDVRNYTEADNNYSDIIRLWADEERRVLIMGQAIHEMFEVDDSCFELMQTPSHDPFPCNSVFDAMAEKDFVDDGLIPTVRVENGKRTPNKRIGSLTVEDAYDSYEAGIAIEVNDGRHITIKRDHKADEFGIKSERAYWMGFNARERGLLEYPSQDAELMEMLCTMPSDKHSDLMEAWREGHRAKDKMLKFIEERKAQEAQAVKNRP